MAIKLYNKTRCPDEILRPLITAAGRRIGVRTGVVVKVMGPVRDGRPHGLVTDGLPYLWHLSRKRVKDGNRYMMIHTDCGWIELHLPRIYSAYDTLEQAERFYRLCLHEWSHIKDCQDGKYFGEYGRRHANRPHERRAFAYVREATETHYSRTAEQAILALAVWLEEQGERR